MKNRKLKVFIVGVLAFALIIGTWAFYTSTTSVDNELTTAKYGNVLKEKFTQPPEWKPGEEVTKEAGVKNTGDYNLVVRVKLTETWTRPSTSTITSALPAQLDSTGNSGADRTKINYTTAAVQTSLTDGLTTGDQTVVKKFGDLTDTTKWILHTDGYWYYTAVLTPDAYTGNFLSKIQLAPDVDFGVYDTTKYYTESAALADVEPITTNIGTNPATQWVSYTGAVPAPSAAGKTVYTWSASKLDNTKAGYSDANYDLIITAETCQATAAAVNATWTTAPASLNTAETATTGWKLPAN